MDLSHTQEIYLLSMILQILFGRVVLMETFLSTTEDVHGKQVATYHSNLTSYYLHGDGRCQETISANTSM